MTMPFWWARESPTTLPTYAPTTGVARKAPARGAARKEPAAVAVSRGHPQQVPPAKQAPRTGAATVRTLAMGGATETETRVGCREWYAHPRRVPPAWRLPHQG